MTDDPIRAALEAATEAAFDVGGGSGAAFLPSCRRTTKSAIVAFLRALPDYMLLDNPLGFPGRLHSLADTVERAGAETRDG